MKQIALTVLVSAMLIGCECAGDASTARVATQVLAKTAELELDRFPLGFWNYTSISGDQRQYLDEEEVASWAQAGFTVPMGPYFNADGTSDDVAYMQKMLDWCAAEGMKMIVYDPRGRYTAYKGDDEAFKATFAKAWADFGSHEGFFGFHVGDEPDAKKNPSFFAAARLQKEVAPNARPFINLLPYTESMPKRVGYPDWPTYLDAVVAKGNVDFLCYDYYRQLHEFDEKAGIDRFYENLRLLREAGDRNGIPFWVTLLSVGHYHYRCPTYDDLRWQFNAALGCGAKGILWFFYYMRIPHDNYRFSPVDEFWERTETYDNLRRVQVAFHRRYGDLFLRITPTKIMFYPEAKGGGEVFRPDDLIADVRGTSTDVLKPGLLITEFADKDARRYVMVVNDSYHMSNRCELHFVGEDVKLSTWDWQGKLYEGMYPGGRLNRKNGTTQVKHWLAPGQEVIYLVEQP